MTTDMQLQNSVMAELAWEPAVDAAHIGVAAQNGVVTLSGHVKSYAQKLAAERAAKRVKGVSGIAEEIEVELPGSDRRSDEDIATSVLNILRWHDGMPAGTIQVKVENGYVVLSGEVDLEYQKDMAGHDAHNVRGVRGLSNQIAVKPRVRPYEIKQKIEEALKRNAELEAKDISVTATGGSVTLSGHVRTWSERSAAQRAAWSAPGVTEVIDNIRIAA